MQVYSGITHDEIFHREVGDIVSDVDDKLMTKFSQVYAVQRYENEFGGTSTLKLTVV